MDKTRCNGYNFHSPIYSEESRKMITSELGNMRIAMMKRFSEGKIDAGQYGMGLEFGWRFTDDSAAIIRIESAVTEEEFKKDPAYWIWSALMDCASSDHWYTHEKDWGE